MVSVLPLYRLAYRHTGKQLSNVGPHDDWGLPHVEERVDERTSTSEDDSNDPYSCGKRWHVRVVGGVYIGTDFGIGRILSRHDCFDLHLSDQIAVLVLRLKDGRIIQEKIDPFQGGTREVLIVFVDISDLTDNLKNASTVCQPISEHATYVDSAVKGQRVDLFLEVFQLFSIKLKIAGSNQPKTFCRVHSTHCIAASSSVASIGCSRSY